VSDITDDYDGLASGHFEDAEGDDASIEADRKVFVMPDPSMEMCPVAPLGFVGRNIVFAMPEGEIRVEPAAKIGAMLKVDIFACAAGTAFLTTWRDSEDKFLRDLAAVWFTRKCREAGQWDTSRPMRGLGVWIGEGDTVVLHRGSEIIEVTRTGKSRRLSIIDALKRSGGGPLYRLRPRAPMPEGAFAVTDGQWTREQLDRWCFQPIGDEGLTGADVALGWIGGGMLGAAAPFRGHMLIHAMAGSGKTTLMHFLQGLMSALVGDVIDDFSEPGLRADLAGMARAVLLDEAESRGDQPGGGAAERMLDLLRRMSTGKGANRKQGSMDGSGAAVTQTALGCVAFAAVNPPRLNGPDVTRVVEVKLMPLGWEGHPLSRDTDIEAAIDRARVLAPALLGRALKSAWRYREDAALIKASLTRDGQSPRAADLISMLAAGRRLLLFDEALTPETAEAEARLWLPLIDAREAHARVENPGADALGHLLAWETGQHRNDRRLTLGEMVGFNVSLKERNEYSATLKAHGLLTYQEADGRPWLIVANHHSALERIFKGTVWQDWSRVLRDLEALGPEFAPKATKPMRYGNGLKQRGLAIPLAPVLENPSLVGGWWEGGTEGGTGPVPPEDIDFDE
jgi:hypothetical protein